MCCIYPKLPYDPTCQRIIDCPFRLVFKLELGSCMFANTVDLLSGNSLSFKFASNVAKITRNFVGSSVFCVLGSQKIWKDEEKVGEGKWLIITLEDPYNSMCKNRLYFCTLQHQMVLWSIPWCNSAAHIWLIDQSAYGTSAPGSSRRVHRHEPLSKCQIQLPN